MLTDLRLYLPGLAPQMMLYCATGIVALALRKRCPAAALCAAAGCAVLFVNIFAGMFFSAYFMGLHRTGAISMAQYGMSLGILGAFKMLLAAGGFVLVFVAVFVGRGKASATRRGQAGRSSPPPL